MRIESQMLMDETSSPSAELCPDPKHRAWFCIRTHMKREHIAAAHLAEMTDVDVFNPRIRLLRSTRRGRKWFRESLFPNYLFARFAAETMVEKIQFTPSVKFLLRFGDHIPTIPDSVIVDLRERLSEMAEEVLTDAPIEGEEVEIARGAFMGTKGVVTRVLPGQQRVRILLDIVGRSVPVELSLDSVLFNGRRHLNALRP